MTEGKPDGDADCFFKASKQMFLDVWNGKYTPSAKDFLMGSIKSNNPHAAEGIRGRLQAAARSSRPRLARAGRFIVSGSRSGSVTT